MGLILKWPYAYFLPRTGMELDRCSLFEKLIGRMHRGQLSSEPKLSWNKGDLLLCVDCSAY